MATRSVGIALTESSIHRGFPDLVAMLGDGAFVVMGCKGPRGRVQPEQLA